MGGLILASTRPPVYNAAPQDTACIGEAGTASEEGDDLSQISDYRVLLRLTALELGVIVLLVAVCWLHYGADSAFAAAIGGGIGLTAYLVSGLVSLRKRRSAKAVYAQLLMGELLKAGIVILGFGLVFTGEGPELEALRQGRDVLLLVAACLSVVVAHALGAVFLYRNTDLPDLEKFSAVKPEGDAENF